MAGLNDRPPALLLLGDGSLPAARRVQAALPGAVIHGLAGRVTGADRSFNGFGATARRLFEEDVPIVGFCAAGIIIRALAPLLQDKRAEPPVLAVAEDGSAVVPLLGGLRGVNALARTIGAALGTAPAITTTGEIRFAATLEAAPEGYTVRNPERGKAMMSDLLAGARVRLSGDAPWLTGSRLPVDPAGTLAITVTAADRVPAPDELIFHPKVVTVAVAGGGALTDLARAALADRSLAAQAVGVVTAAERDAARPEVHAVAAAFDRPLRILPDAAVMQTAPVTLTVADSPLDPAAIGRGRGSLTVVGLGPGAPEWLAPAARDALAAATDLVGYATYLEMAGPLRADQVAHASDNREELARARHALALAAAGRSVAVVSSGDPGIFAMAAAVMEAVADEPAWQAVEIAVIPGISAAQAAAARVGAPLGHDFCMLSLSDNLKPWAVIERRLDLAAAADLVLALYNPISRARPWQLGRALEVIRRHRAGETPVVLGRDVGRPGERMAVLALADLQPEAVDMRTVVIVGSSTTRRAGRWVYTPRSYPAD